jgi:hypothetical protein
MKSLLLTVTTALFAQSALANPGISPYSFGGSCPSQGTWTQTVLSQTQRLKEVIEGLENDPNCKALAGKMQGQLQSIQGALGTAEQQKGYSSVANLMGQISSLTSYVKSGPTMSGPVANSLMNSKLSLGEADASAGLIPDSGKKIGFSTLGQRAAAATDAGLTMFNNLVDGIAMQERCIQDQGNLTGQLFSGSVYLLSAFAASGDSAAGAKISESISKLAGLISSSKFRKSLAKLDMIVYQNSIRCMMEMTADSFCSIKDNLEIVKLGVDSLSVKSLKVVAPTVPSNNFSLKTPQLVSKLVTNPFSGMYVLTHHLPNITAFIQKVMLGVEPNTPYEAAQKNEIMNDLSNYQQSVNSILGTFNRAAMNIANTASIQAQRNQILSMLSETYDAMRESGKNTNFFKSTRPMSEWKLFLLGIPKEAWPKEFFTGSSAFDVNRWLETNANSGTLAEFNNPSELIGIVRQNLLKFVDEANLAATSYYSQWFLADKVGILDSLVADQRFTVKESLLATMAYLNELEKRITGLKGDREILKSIADTKSRIKSSLSALEVYNQANTGNPAELQAAASTVVSQIFTDFNILLNRTSFLSSRISNYVRYDYRILIQSGLDMSDYQKSLLLVMGQDLMGQMELMQNKSLQTIQSDLKNASSIALQNLSVFEDVFRDEFSFQTSLWKMRSEGKKISNWTVGDESIKRLYEDSRADVNKVEPGDSGWTRFWKGVNAFIDPIAFGKASINQFNEQKYPNAGMPLRHFPGSGVDDEYKSAEHIFAQMCIQSLGFNKWKDFAQMCEKAILHSVFEESGLNADQLKSNLSVNYAEAYHQFKAPNAQNQAARICAFRNFYRNNYVFQLTVGNRN